MSAGGNHRVWHVYYCYAADGTLLYVGQTHSPIERLSLHGHYSGSPWFYHCTDVVVSVPLTKAEARRREREEISTLRPVYNRQHNPTPSAWSAPEFAARRYGTLPAVSWLASMPTERVSA